MARRGRGDGALFRRSDGYWVGAVELPPGPDGKRRTKRIVRKNRNECAEALRNLKKDIAAGLITGAPNTTVAKWIDYWQREILPTRDITVQTADSYRDHARLYVVPTLGKIRLDRLQPADVRRLYRHVTDTVSSRAAQKADQVLRLALDAAVRDGVIGVSVMDRVDKPRHTKQEAFAFDAATATRLLHVADQTQGTMWAGRWALGFLTGVRESELLGLEWDRVDDDRLDISWQLLRLQKSHGCGKPVAGKYPCGKQRSSFCPQAHWQFPPGMRWRECVDTLVFTPPKTAAGRRVIPVIPAIKDILDTLRALPGPNPHNLVLHRPDGYPITQDEDQRMWRKLLKSAGHKHVRQHSVRHSTATLLLEAGVDVHVVQSVIGHADIAVTRGYQHVDLELARRGWANLDGLRAVGEAK